MYDETIKVANKIITDTDIFDICAKMNDKIKEYQKLCEEEKIKNEKFEHDYQNWTVKNFDGSFSCAFNFYDDTDVTVDNYGEFLNIFNNRLHSVQDMRISFSMSYWIQNGSEQKLVHHYLYLYIYEYKMDISIKMSSDDDKMQDVYTLIKERVISAPEKYDRIMQKKNQIKGRIGFAQGMIPALVICTLLAFVGAIREIYGLTFVLYPIAVLTIGYLLGSSLFIGKISNLYEPLLPKQMYAGYDADRGKSIYKDDINDYVSTSEILIGKNVNNMKCRQEIKEMEEYYKKWLPIEFMVLGFLSILMIIIGRFL